LYVLQGANVGDALLRSERLVKWNIWNIGDPLYRPFGKRPELAAKLRPAVVFALLPQTALAGTESGAGIALEAHTGDVTFALTADRADLLKMPAMVTVPAAREGVRFVIEPARCDQRAHDHPAAREGGGIRGFEHVACGFGVRRVCGESGAVESRDRGDGDVGSAANGGKRCAGDGANLARGDCGGAW
jgi:hypothetical protein